MKFIVYCTTCVVNGKIYVGVHKTEDPYKFDGYIGCGISKINQYYILHPITVFHKAVKKYGYNKFKRAVLHIYDNEESAFLKEAEIVNLDFLKRHDTYNTAIGGRGGSNLSHPKQYDINGVFIKDFLCVEDIVKELGFKRASIDDAMSRKKPLHGYYFISNGNIYDIIKSNDINSSKKDLNISCYCPITKKLINTFESLKDAGRKTHSDTRTLKKYIKTGDVFKEYIWSYGYSKEYIKIAEPKARKVAQYDLEGNLIKIWDRVVDCAKEHPKVRDVLKGSRKKTHNFTFKFVEE